MKTCPRFKVCCIASVAEAQLAVDAGAAAVGLVSAMPSGPGPIDEALITQIAATVPPGVSAFLLTSLRDVDAIVAQQRRCRTDTIQLCDALQDGDHARLRAELTGVRLVQVVHVEDERAVDEAQRVAPHVDAVLLDSGRPSAAVKELGGTGRRHDWAISRRVVETCGKPVYLAGGLNADNAAEAIAAVRPFGLDVCSGLRTAGRLDPQKLHAFADAVRKAATSN